MHKAFIYAAYGWLTFSSTMQFIIDVASQYFRGKRASGPETTLYYGLNTSFAFGQVLFGLICLWLAWRTPAILDERPVMVVSALAATGWLAITFSFMEYWEPKLNGALFAALITVAIITA